MTALALRSAAVRQQRASVVLAVDIHSVHYNYKQPLTLEINSISDTNEKLEESVAEARSTCVIYRKRQNRSGG